MTLKKHTHTQKKKDRSNSSNGHISLLKLEGQVVRRVVGGGGGDRNLPNQPETQHFSTGEHKTPPGKHVFFKFGQGRKKKN